ncbi:MAG: hypothetical protein HKO02_00035 [Hyphomonadaceae bacterium]|nr:hypothetical protein [Hyphomonadaceae bacterium]
MIKTSIYSIAIISLLGATAAHAETFTYKSIESSEPKVIGGVGQSGADYYASSWSGTTDVKNADGTSYKSSFTCMSMTQPPNSQIFATHVVCDMTSPRGNASMVFGCIPLNAEKTEMNCMGGMSGKSGTYQDRSGTITAHITPDGNSGTGQWN